MLNVQLISTKRGARRPLCEFILRGNASLSRGQQCCAASRFLINGIPHCNAHAAIVRLENA